MPDQSRRGLPFARTQRAPQATSIYLVRTTTPWNDFWRQYNSPSPTAFAFTTHNPADRRIPYWQILAITEADLNSQVPPLIPSRETAGNCHPHQTVRDAWKTASTGSGLYHRGSELCIEIGLTPNELRRLVTDGHLDLETLKVMLALTPAPARPTSQETVGWYTLILDTITAAHEASRASTQETPRGR